MKVKLRLDALELRDVPSAVVDAPLPPPDAVPAQSPAEPSTAEVDAWLDEFYANQATITALIDADIAASGDLPGYQVTSVEAFPAVPGLAGPAVLLHARPRGAAGPGGTELAIYIPSNEVGQGSPLQTLESVEGQDAGGVTLAADPAPRLRWWERLGNGLAGAGVGAGTGAVTGGAAGGLVGTIVPGPGTLAGVGAGATAGAIWGGVTGFIRGVAATDIGDAAEGAAIDGALAGVPGGAVAARVRAARAAALAAGAAPAATPVATGLAGLSDAALAQIRADLVTTLAQPGLPQTYAGLCRQLLADVGKEMIKRGLAP